MYICVSNVQWFYGYIPIAVAIGLENLTDSNKRVYEQVIFQEGHVIT